MDFKLIASEVDVSQTHQLFDSCPNFPPIDPKIDTLFGAFDGKRLVAATSAMPTSHNKKHGLWSNFLIVDPEYRRQGIGFRLKQFQRSWALDHRYTTIMWAFDPFEIGLAKFYFHDLGATANIIHPNSESKTNNSIPIPCSLEVVWRLKDHRVKALAARKQVSNSFGSTPFALEVGEIGQPVSHSAFDSAANSAYRVEISNSIMNRVGDSKIGAWNQALEECLKQGFLNKYTISDFEIENECCWYVLTAPTTWFLYVVECSDQTLYTGITPDLDRRLKLHNAGRGAAYTAARTPVHIVATWKFPHRIAAMRAEIAFKRMSRERKLQHINAELDFCGAQFLSRRA